MNTRIDDPLLLEILILSRDLDGTGRGILLRLARAFHFAQRRGWESPRRVDYEAQRRRAA